MLHYYFKDRDQLLDAVVDERSGPRTIAQVWDPVQPGASAADTVRGIVERLLDGIEEMPWIPSTWMREVLNEGGLLRERMLRRLPFEKVRSVGSGNRPGTVAAGLQPRSRSGADFVFSTARTGHVAHGHDQLLGRNLSSQSHSAKQPCSATSPDCCWTVCCHSPATTPAKKRSGKKPSRRQRA